MPAPLIARRTVVAAALWMLSVIPAPAQYAITPYSIAGGGGASASGAYTLVGTIGEPAVGSATAGTFTLTSGFTLSRITFVPFADHPLIAGVTVVRAVHVAELMTRIDAARSRFGLAGFAFTFAPAAGVTISAQHVTELRAALAQAYAAAGRTPPIYSDGSLTTGTVIRATHLNELRAAVIALEN